MNAIFLRALETNDKASAVLAAIKAPDRLDGAQRFDVDVDTFATVPRSPFAYWVSPRMRRLFGELSPLEGDDRTVKVGLQTSDDFRFVRCSWEVAATEDAGWFPFAKGGRRSPFYRDVALVVNWRNGGREVYEFNGIPFGRAGAPIRNPSYYFRSGITWPLRGIHFSAQVVPAGSIFGIAGKMVFAPSDELLWLLALMNASAFDRFIAFFAGKVGGVQYEVGLIQSVPVPKRGESDDRVLAVLARRGWSLKRGLDTRVEVSHAFVLPALLQVEGASLAERGDAWAARVRAVEAELEEIQAEIDERCFDLYGIGAADRRAISEGLQGDAAGVEAEEPAVEDADEEEDVETRADAAGLAAELVSWAVGVAFGRFDLRLATGEREWPRDPEPFDPLPVCSPGMLFGDAGLPVASRPEGYPIDFPEAGVLMDDPGDPRDLTAAVREVFDVVFGGDADAWWDEAAALLDPRGHDLRGWLARSFFDRHLKLYSRSRRKAPILWQLGTPSGRYSVWLYAHRLTEDSFFRLQSDVLAPKLAYEERQLADLLETADDSPSSKQRKEIEAQEKFVEELRVLLEEARRLAPLWRPALDDGIVLVVAPLWRLVPHKSWQRELKKKWSELADGKYDFAQLAMRLWPERVIPKCADDRSLAIAHGLEDVFWFEDEGGKWQLRDEPTKDVEKLIRDHTSTAAREALGAAA